MFNFCKSISFRSTPISKRFREEETKETEALTESLRDLEVESSKKTYGFYGPIFSMLAIPGLTRAHKMLSLGELSFGTSFYIIRAETLPPRKDCIRRGLEGLIKTPSTIPINN